MALKDQHIVFALDYLKHFNGARAARNAGYSEKHADRQAYILLRRADIQEFLANKRKQITDQADVELLDIIRHLKAMAFFDIRDVLHESGKIKPIEEWPDIACQVISGLKITTQLFDEDIATITEIKIPSREKNTENLGRYVGAFTDNVKVDAGDGVKRIYVFPGFKPGMPIPDEVEDGGNGRFDDDGNDLSESEDGGNGKHRTG